MARRLVFNAREVVGFSPPGDENHYVSRLLIDRHSVGSNQLVVNHFTLKPGVRMAGGSHPDPYDEFYYVLRGRGRIHLGEPVQTFEVEPDSVVFIPAGTYHSLENTGTADMEIITAMPEQPEEGANLTYDARLRAWGTSFKLVRKE